LKLQKSIDRVSASSAVARDKIVGYATQLKNSRFQGKQLETALEGMAIAGAAGGDKLANQFMGLAQNARFFGQDLDKLTQRFKTKFGAVAEARLLSLGVQFSKFKENITWIFSGADIEPFLKGLHTILGLFDRNTDGAKGMRSIVTKLTEAAIGGFLRLAIFLVRTYIWLKTHAVAWKTVELIVTGVKTAFVVLGVLAAAALGIILASMAACMAMSALVWAGIGAIGEGLAAVWTYFSTHSLSEIGTEMINGLVAGLKAGGHLVLDALTSIVTGAVKGVKKYLGIASESKLMRAEVGYEMGAGTAGGLDKSRAEVSDAAEGMAAVGVQGAKGGASATAAPSSSGNNFYFTNCTFGGDFNEAAARKMFHTILDGEINAASVAA
jgi:phage-related protein